MRDLANRFVYALTRVVCVVFGGAFWHLRFAGSENVPDEGGVILACSHESFLDPPLVGSGIPRRAKYLARRSLTVGERGRSRFKTFVLRMYGVVELDRDGGGGAEGLRQALDVLAQGHPLIMFPEGTRSVDGKLLPFKAGIGLVALRSGAPVVPVSVDGTRRVWRRGQKRPRLFGGPISIRYGEKTTYTRPTKAKDVAADLRDRILALREDGQPGTARDGADPHEGTDGSPST